MKRLISFLLVLAIAAVFPATASAADDPAAHAPIYAAWDDYDWLEDVFVKLQEKMYEEYKGGDALPFWCWYDINKDGVYEIIVDNNNGKYGVEIVNSKMLKGTGSKDIVTKGDFSLYYWDFKAQKAASARINSNNMFISVTPEGTLVASSVNGSTETFSVYAYYSYGKFQAKTYTITYSGNKIKTIKVKDYDGKNETFGDDWTVRLELSGIVNRSTPLTFYQSS